MASDEKPGINPPQEAPQIPVPAPASSPPPRSQEDFPDLKVRIQRLVHRWFGVWGLVMLAIFAVAGGAWWNWEAIRVLPGVSPFLKWMFEQPIPPVDPERFAVAIAHLEHDKDHYYEMLIIEALKDFAGEERSIQILRFDRTISLTSTQPEKDEQAGHDKAREYIQASGADVLIWGMLHHLGDQSAPRLYWTMSQKVKRAEQAYQLEKFKLPDLFWDQLVEVLRLVVAAHYIEFFAQEGHFTANRLAPFIERVRKLRQIQNQQGWAADTRAEVGFFFAYALSIFGRQTGKNEFQEEAVAIYTEVLRESPREQVPFEWATVQNNLGNTLRQLGEWEGSTARVEEAVAAYREALTEQTRDRVPLAWATTQHNLGSALQTLGKRKKEVRFVCEALGNHVTAWEVFSTVAPYLSSLAVDNAKRDLSILKNEFELLTWESCLANYQENLRHMGLLEEQGSP